MSDCLEDTRLQKLNKQTISNKTLNKKMEALNLARNIVVKKNRFWRWIVHNWINMHKNMGLDKPKCYVVSLNMIQVKLKNFSVC